MELVEIRRAQAWRDMGLKDSEYQRIVDRLGREPNWTELGMFAVLWSEHCAYKHSRRALKRLPTEGDHVVVGPGENAGVIDIGEDVLIAFREESHNHPCAIEPYQGAATGVGGILRDILAMGARPIALLDSLHFGELDDARVRHLFSGVVAGISGYGNCVGVPTVGGEVGFDESYRGNPLCNVMCVGTIERDKLTLGVAAGIGNVVMYLGSHTGRDGIHGATFASDELTEASEERRPSVQVGDPFMEKLLIEACLELVDSGHVVGVQDMGAAGLTSTCAEMAARAGTGVEIDLDLVPQREENMTPYEMMLSESQERMLLIVGQGNEEDVRRLCSRWGLNCVPIGRVTGDGMLRVNHAGSVAAEVPASALTDEAPAYDPESRKPLYIEAAQEDRAETIPIPDDFASVLTKLLASPNIADKGWVYRQYDYQVRTNTVVVPGAGDAAVLRVRGTQKGIAVKMDSNARFCYLDPYQGAAIAVAEAARNVVCTGAKPMAITNCLNFGNPEKPEIYWQFDRAIDGMGEACRQLKTPVTGGNVSFYNEHGGTAVYPTPVVGMVGLLDDVSKHCTMGFKDPGDVVVVLGETRDELGGSEYTWQVHGVKTGPVPHLDLAQEKAVQAVCLEAVHSGIVKSAHDCAEGGLGVCLAESSIESGIGIDAAIDADIRPDAVLFGESQSRIVVTVAPKDLDPLGDLASQHDVPFTVLGSVGGNVFRIAVNGRSLEVAVAELESSWKTAIPSLMDHDPSSEGVLK